MSNPSEPINSLQTAWRRLKLLSASIATFAAGLTIANLPVPGLREAISTQAPLLLLPSVAAWDYHYREGMVDFQQAEQLIEQAKHPNDLDQGDRKLKSAQSHLNALPLQGFDRYSDTYYCSFRSCSWNFSSYEIQQRREAAGRIEAILTQERNLQSQMAQIITAIENNKAQFKNAKTEPQKQTILAEWEQKLNQLDLLESNRLMGRIANTEHRQLMADYQKVTGLTQAQKRSGTILQAAEPFAQAAQKLTASKKSHTVTEWQAIVRQWNLAINQIQDISSENPDYVKSRQVMANYQQQVDRATTRLTEEQTAVDSLERIEGQINDLVQNHSSLNRDQAKAKLIQIEAELKKIPVGTTVYEQAQDWLGSLRSRLNS